MIVQKELKLGYITVFSRSSDIDYSHHLQPVWSYSQIKDGYVETIYENIYNVLFFIPYGILLSIQLRNLSLVKIIAVGCMTSVFIEILQLVTRTGCCETDDVIHNTLGFLIGVVIVMMARSILKRNK